MITIGTIVRWEGLTHKPFSQYNVSDNKDLSALYYASQEPREYTLDVYTSAVLDTEVGQTQLLEFARGVVRNEQYIKQFMWNEPKAHTDEEPQSITDIVGALMFRGINSEWLLNCGLEYLAMLCDSEAKFEKNRLEEIRTKLYFQLSPYTDRDKVKNVHDFMPFEWDNEQSSISKINDIDLDLANSFLGKKAPKTGKKGPK